MKEGAKRSAVVPELAVSVSPLMMAVSGKAPVTDALEEGPVRQAAGRQWRLLVHPEVNLAGVQPTVVMPQVGLRLARLPAWTRHCWLWPSLTQHMCGRPRGGERGKAGREGGGAGLTAAGATTGAR